MIAVGWESPATPLALQRKEWGQRDKEGLEKGRWRRQRDPVPRQCQRSLPPEKGVEGLAAKVEKRAGARPQLRVERQEGGLPFLHRQVDVRIRDGLEASKQRGGMRHAVGCARSSPPLAEHTFVSLLSPSIAMFYWGGGNGALRGEFTGASEANRPGRFPRRSPPVLTRSRSVVGNVQ